MRRNPKSDRNYPRFTLAWEGDHVRLVLTPKDSKGLTKELVSQVSAQLRKIGCRCVLDEALRDHSRCAKPARVYRMCE